MVLRWVVVVVLMLVGAYVGYALAAGYVGVLPTPLNLAAGVGALVTAGFASTRLVRRPTEP